MTPNGEDDELLEELRAALRAAGSPTPSMSAAAAAAFSWRTVDAELAELEAEEPGAEPDDPAREDYALARNGSNDPPVLRFTAPGGTVELEAADDGWAGVLEPAAAGEVTVLGPDGTTLERAPVDELGAFFLGPAAGGPVRLRCRTAAGELLTDWAVLR